MDLLDLLNSYCFQGITGNAAFSLVTKLLTVEPHKHPKDVYLDAAYEIANRVRPR